MDEDRKLVSWSDVGRLLASDPSSWSDYMRYVHEFSRGHAAARIEDWYVHMLSLEANEHTAGNVGVELVDVSPDGLEIRYSY